MDTKSVAVAMSGGVDSSVAAALCQEQGYRVFGVMMKLWDGEDATVSELKQSCYGPGEAGSIENARRIASKLDIPFHVIDVSAEFREAVLAYTGREYLAGRTPNPCVQCNRRIKFEALIEKAEAAGLSFDYFATGHYCKVEYDTISNRYLLKKGKDPAKDQSYFLAFLTQQQLSRVMFPVGDMTKPEVKARAAELKLGLEGRPESQDFTSAGYRTVIGEDRPGRILTSRGEILGNHQGISNFTIGQRKGLGVSYPEPLYVTDIDPESGDITVGQKTEIYSNHLTVSGLNWIETDKPDERMELQVKIRYAHPAADATVSVIDPDTLEVAFREPQMAITPGQAAVFYRGDTVAGAGIINRNK